MPNGTMLACTWNEELLEELFTREGKEMNDNNIDVLLGPGMNIHRHPLCGRNFEYLSEDPLISGRMAYAQCKGMANAGVSGTIKHLCANNQENNRHNLDSVVSERALREIYPKPFEIAVRLGDACKAVMTSYNPVNGTWMSEEGLKAILDKFEKGALLLESKDISAGKEVVFVCEQAGDYILGADIASVGTQLSQNTMIFYANGEYITSFAVSGSNGQVAENLKRVTLTAGENRITIKYPQDALSIDRLCIYREKLS